MRLTRERRVVMRLLGRELEYGDGCHPLCVLDLLRLLRDALGDDCAAAVEPRYLKLDLIFLQKSANLCFELFSFILWTMFSLHSLS